MNYTQHSSKIVQDVALTFDDVNLIPSYSEIKTRSDVELTTKFTTNYKIDIPIIASPMSSICEYDMAYKMAVRGGVGIVHRFMSIEQQCSIVKKLLTADSSSNKVIAASIGLGLSELERAKHLIHAGINVLVIDVAHGHHLSVGKMLDKLTAILNNDNMTHVDIVAGNVATPSGVLYLEEHGANGIRVGIGGGSVCETRLLTGFGIPQLSSVLECAEVASVPIISCGGCRYPGDIAKALAAGADSVILGSMLAATSETPGTVHTNGPYGNRFQYKLYHGSASDIQKTLSGTSLRHIEGAATLVRYKGATDTIIDEIVDGLRSAFSYAGASDIDEFVQNTKFCKITNSGTVEAKPHLIG